MNESILKILKPWMIKPFQFLFHAETHYQNSSDYSKRMAYINFDNSIEVSIYTFMHINKKPKGSSIYKKEDLEKVKNSFFSKLEVFENYIQSKGLPIKWDKDSINYYHEQRNTLYHDAILTSPDTNELNKIRQISFWVFSILFDIINIEEVINASLLESEREFPQIPVELVKPKIGGIQADHETSLFIASILGGWNENTQGDNDIIGEVTSGF